MVDGAVGGVEMMKEESHALSVQLSTAGLVCVDRGEWMFRE